METSADSITLSESGLMDRWYDVPYFIFHWKTYSDMVDQAWAKVGITSVTRPFTSNHYYKDNKEIPQDLAWYIARNH